MIQLLAIIAAVISLTVPWSGFAQADELAAGGAVAEQSLQVVVLHNGSVIHGQVEESRDRLIVSNGPSYVVRVPVSDVDLVVPDLAAAYRAKRARLRQRDFQQHLSLAQWCIRHDLDPFAADQLLHLVRLDPHHSSVKGLEQQLMQRANEPRTRESDSAASLPSLSGGQSPRRPGAETTSDELPPVHAATLTEFTRSIQPLLLNRCGQTTCHGSAGQSQFHLQRLTASGDARRALTLRNLRAAIAQIDSARPDESPLVELASRPHGSALQSPLGPHDMRQYQRLLDWVHRVVNGEPAELAAPDGLLATSAWPSDSAAAALPISALRSTPVAGSLVPTPSGPGAANLADSTPSEVPASIATTSSDADPYDPGEFNARLSHANSEGAAP